MRASPARLGGALALLATGAVHLQQVVANQFGQIPTIGVLFVLNFAGATALGLLLLAPVGRLVDRRLGGGGRAVTVLAALSGAGLAGTAFVFLLVSEHMPLFGFQEQGYRPAVVAALVAEPLTVLGLGSFAALSLRRGGGPARTR